MVGRTPLENARALDTTATIIVAAALGPGRAVLARDDMTRVARVTVTSSSRPRRGKPPVRSHDKLPLATD